MKKSVLLVAAIASVVAVAGKSVFAAGKYAVKDLVDLSRSLLGEIDVNEEQDVDGNGEVDVFDLVAMRKTFLGTGDFSMQTINASEDNVKYIGRNIYDENNIAWLVQSGSAIEFTVNAKSAEITINGDEFTESDEKYRPRYAIIVDDKIILDELLDVKEKTVKLFDEDSVRTANVKIIHLSEANNGAVGVSNIVVNSDSPIPVVPAQKKNISIEFIGDSITCAYGVEAQSQYDGFSTATENFMKSYAYLTAKQLDADYSSVSYSGHGIISGYSTNGEAVTDSLVPDYYDYVGKLGSYKVPWDFKTHRNDVVVINLGTNDHTYVSYNDSYDTRGPEYAESYTKFLEHIHEVQPNAYIICTVGTMGCTEMYPFIEEAVANFKKITGYDRIMSYQSATHTQSDGYGADWHPSEKTQQNSAYVLADKICQALGMESSQIGLNVSADAVYTSQTDDSANMSAYFSEWDGSYHITTVAGGKDKESIQAFVSGIDLKKNGKYRLSFQIETNDGEEIPFVIRSRDTKEIIFEDTFIGTGEKTSYEAEFKSKLTADSEIVFNLGGTDNLRMSLYEVRTVKFE